MFEIPIPAMRIAAREIKLKKLAKLSRLKKNENVFKDGISPDKLADIGEAHPGAIMALNGEEMPAS